MQPRIMAMNRVSRPIVELARACTRWHARLVQTRSSCPAPSRSAPRHPMLSRPRGYRPCPPLTARPRSISVHACTPRANRLGNFGLRL